jgi:hypothetical protein
MIGPVKARITVAALAAVVLLVGAASAWAALVIEGSPYTVGNDPYSLTTADFNGDGRADVATINGSSDDVSVYLRQPGGGFVQEAGSPFSAGGAGVGPSGATVGDFNGDGLTDLAVSNFPGASVAVLLRQAGGGFVLEGGQAIPLGTRIGGVAAGDFNSDGRLDLAATAYDSSQVVLRLRNSANTGFDTGPSYATGTTPDELAAGDFNGDGSVDLAVANVGTDNITILLRSGGSFSSEAAVPVGADPVEIVATDFDGNGRADLAVASYAAGTVSALVRNPSNDGFTVESPAQVTSPASVTAADFDRDGRPDLAVASNSGSVQTLIRNAGGGFTLDQTIPIAGAVNGVSAADFDGDSRPDLAASSYTGAPTDVFVAMLNPGPPAPPPPTPLPDPVAGKNVNVEPVSGTVRIRRPGSNRFVTLTAEAQIPVGSTIDTRKGRIEITAAQGGSRTASADFFDGLFRLTQTKGAKPLTTLALTERLSCPRKAKSAIAAAKKKKRRLWGDGSGRFRTKGKHSAATVVGTRWLVEDRCRSTLTRVVRGRVKVRDFVKKKTVTVRAGKRYTARAKRK